MTKPKFGGRFLAPAFLAAVVCLAVTADGPAPVRAQTADQSISVQTSPQLFATMCALDAAGFDANSNTLDIYPEDAVLRARLLQLKGPAVVAMRQFYAQHQFANSDKTLSPFLSFALVVGPPPRFRYLISH